MNTLITIFKFFLGCIFAYYASILITSIIKRLFLPKNKTNNLKNIIINSIDIPYDFKLNYESISKKNNTILEKKRKFLIFLIITKYLFLLYILISPTLFSKNYISNMFVFACIILSMLFYNYLGKIIENYENNYKKMYKNIVVPSILNFLNEKYLYKPTITNSSASKEYLDAKFDGIPFGKFLSDDFIKVSLLNRISLNICDVCVLDVNKKEKLFNGFFVYSTFDTYIPLYIKIKKDQIKLYDNKNKIDADISEFEKYFDIYSENKIATLRILTADIMDYLLEIYNTYNLDFEIVIFEKKFYLRIFSGNSFEANILKSSLDINLLFSYYLILKLIIDITKKFETALHDFEL